MLKRALLILLVACLALPAMAMTGHCAAPSSSSRAAASCHESKTQKEPMQRSDAARDCIGCVTPPFSGAGPQADEVLSELPLSFADDAPLLTNSVGPAPPPPRP